MKNSDYTEIRLVVLRDELEKWSTIELKDLLSKAVLQLDGYHIKIMFQDRDCVKFTDSGNIIFEAGIQIYQPAGLFSVEAFGRIQAEFCYDIVLSEKLELDTSLQIFHHTWSETPKVKIGKLLIPIESISNYVISKMQDDISTYIKHKIKDSLDLQALIRHWTTKLGTNYLLNKDYNVYLNTIIDGIQIQKPFLQDNVFILNSKVAMSVIFSNRRLAFISPTNPGLLADPEADQMGVEFSLRWDNFSHPLTELLKTMEYGGKSVEAENLIVGWDESLYTRLELVSPVKMRVSARLDPIFEHRSGCLVLKNHSIEVIPDNLLYKLATPVIKSAISKQIENIFPVNLQELLKTQLSLRIPQKMQFGQLEISHSYTDIEVTDCIFNSKGVELKVKLKSLKLETKLSLEPNNPTI